MTNDQVTEQTPASVPFPGVVPEWATTTDSTVEGRGAVTWTHKGETVTALDASVHVERMDFYENGTLDLGQVEVTIRFEDHFLDLPLVEAICLISAIKKATSDTTSDDLAKSLSR